MASCPSRLVPFDSFRCQWVLSFAIRQPLKLKTVVSRRASTDVGMGGIGLQVAFDLKVLRERRDAWDEHCGVEVNIGQIQNNERIV